MCKSDLYGVRHMKITTAMATITEITAIATVAACATRKTRNDDVTESVAGRSLGHSMWIWKKWGIGYINNACPRRCPEGLIYASARRHEKWIRMKDLKNIPWRRQQVWRRCLKFERKGCETWGALQSAVKIGKLGLVYRARIPAQPVLWSLTLTDTFLAANRRLKNSMHCGLGLGFL